MEKNHFLPTMSNQVDIFETAVVFHISLVR